MKTSYINMKFNINTKKRIRIIKTQLWKIKREDEFYNDEPWFNVFVKKFANESGLVKTSIRSASRSNIRRYGSQATNDIYFFKIEDKNKYMLAKIKYGI